jgi:hypothetical protein
MIVQPLAFLFFRIFTFLKTKANPFCGRKLARRSQLPKNAAQSRKTL